MTALRAVGSSGDAPRSSTPARCRLVTPVACTSSAGSRSLRRAPPPPRRCSPSVERGLRLAARAPAVAPTPKKASRTSSNPLPSATAARQARPWRSRRGGARTRRSRRGVYAGRPGTRIAVSTSLGAQRGLEQALKKSSAVHGALALAGRRSRPRRRARAGTPAARPPGRRRRSSRRWCRGCGSPDGRCAAWRARSAARARDRRVSAPPRHDA